MLGIVIIAGNPEIIMLSRYSLVSIFSFAAGQKFLVLISAFYAMPSLPAQNTAPDDLIAAWRSKSIEYRDVYPDSALHYAREIVRLSTVLNLREYRMQGAHLTGKTYMLMGDYARADSFAGEALRLARQ